MERMRSDVTDARKPRRRFEFFLRRILKMYTLGACAAGGEAHTRTHTHTHTHTHAHTHTHRVRPEKPYVRAVQSRSLARSRRYESLNLSTAAACTVLRALLTPLIRPRPALPSSAVS